MINTKQVMLQTNLAEIPDRDHQSYATTFFKRTQPKAIRGQRRLLDSKSKTEANDESYDQQVMEKKAKTDLFEQSENGNHKQAMNCYPKIKGSNQSKNSLLQNDQKITAFEDIMEIKEFQATEFVRQDTDSSTKSKRLTGLNKRSLIANQQVYWNKKQHQPTLVLRPAVLNPVIELGLTKAQTILLNSPLSKNGIMNHFDKKRNFESLIKDFARKTKDICISDTEKSTSTKQKTKKVITLSKRLARLRSKSMNVIEHQNRKNFLYNEIQKMAQKCEFDLQIKCLNQIKQEVCSRKEEISKHNQDLKEQIRHLIIRQNKLGDKKYSEVLLNGKAFDCDGQALQYDRSDEERKSKLRSIHDRSKSCIVTTFKGPENKKLKITNILGKIAKYKNHQLDRRRKSSQKCPQEGLQSDLQLIKYHTKIEEKQDRQKNDSQILKVHQQFSQQEARRSLIKSIKTFCINKNAQRLPFMNNLMKKMDHQ